MKPTLFAVGDEPYCLWEDDVQERSREFLDGLDPDFFEYLLRINDQPEEEKRASVAIRLALHHAIETLYSLLGAYVQAPQCPYAWISQCQTEDLRKIVQRIGKGDKSLITPWRFEVTGWEAVSAAVFSRYSPSPVAKDSAIKGFSKFWATLSSLLLSEVANQEYNAIKHGFRTRSGGFSLAVGKQDAPGVPAPDSAMQLIGESKFGAMFYKVERIKERGGRHLQSKRTAVNWSVDRDLLLLQVTHFSINNVITALKIANGAEASSCQYFVPSDDEDYMRAWSHSPGVLTLNINSQLNPADLPVLTKAQLLEQLKKPK